MPSESARSLNCIHTCEPVSTDCRDCPVRVFQNRMVLSAVPPPDARIPCWCGDHVKALIAAEWSVYLCMGALEDWLHISN